MNTYCLVDLGNTRYKWCFSDGERLSVVSKCSYEAETVHLMRPLLAEIPYGCLVVVASVKSEATNQWLRAELAQTTGLVPLFMETGACGGVEVAYDLPNMFGVDRYAALLGAKRLGLQSALIIDAGTAVTFDVLLGASHVGGCIFPGRELLAQSLFQGTARISKDPTDRPPHLLAHSTKSGVFAGANAGFIGAVAHIASEIKRGSTVPLTTIVTGGDAGELMVALPGASVDDLIMFRGMLEYRAGMGKQCVSL